MIGRTYADRIQHMMIGVSMNLSARIAIIGSFLLVSQLSHAGALILSGTVPDRGYTIQEKLQNVTITPNKNSELTVYVSSNAVKPQRMPQSVEENAPQIKNLQKENNWVKLTQLKQLSGDYRVKVVAP